ncbi:MAG: hypothetical protein JNM31_11490 [Flavobacteriales bacterium]|nr:hypothetical protein [Flavobacteriales bacterium]
MRTRNILTGTAVAALLASCSTMQPTAGTLDGVYQRPDPRGAPTGPVTNESTGDYYDPNEAQAYTTERGYYDVTYNDPHYYNYDRFRFNMGVSSWNGNTGWGMGMGNTWGDPFWGSGMGWGMNSMWGSPFGGMGSCWGNPGWGMGMGMGMGMGWGDPFWGMGMGWGNPWCGMGWGSPWGWGGPFQSPWGSCFSCYTPVVVTTPMVVGHRPTVSSGGGTGGGGGTIPGQPTYTGRSPVNLLHSEQMKRRPTEALPQSRPGSPSAKPQRGSGGSRESNPQARPQRNPTPNMAPGGSRGGGFSPPSPSRSGGGGMSPSIPSRPR